MSQLKDYVADVELACIEIRVKAKNQREAKKKVKAALKKKNPIGLIKRSWPDNKECIYIDEV